MNKLKAYIFLLCLVTTNIFAQAPTGYYNSTRNLCGEELRQKLSTIISSHTALSYDDLWDAYEQTDLRDNGMIWDMYSNCQFDFGRDQCGGYSRECDCYNREHSMPQSWFGEASPMKTDLFHVYPTDGWVNNKRGNLPFGEVSNPSYTSGNGSKVGPCSYPGYTGTVFEPIDEYKGDFARSYFYMSTCYANKNLGQSSGSAMFSGSQLKQWAVNMLLEWHHNDPVSQKEIDRNNAIYGIQHNRNPFIDCPYFVDAIWATHCDFDNCLEPEESFVEVNAHYDFSIMPNPASERIQISSDDMIVSISIFNILGEKTFSCNVNSNTALVEIYNMEKGPYFVRAEFADGQSLTKKLIIY